MHVVATAGHVDHGKSSLVEVLTGSHPDRLEEERRRGVSIRLGYAWCDLPRAGEVAFVDVPGHQRYVATAIAGVSPSPTVLFVVAADDPWMPQASEHLAVLDAMGVDSGVLVVTRSDLASAATALANARRRLEPTSLGRIPHVAVSAKTGAGIGHLANLLADELIRSPRPNAGADVRLWIDRAFHVRGTGTVVTGTLPAGTIRLNDRLALDGQSEVRVRTLEALGRPRESVSGPARVAIGIPGRAAQGLGEGSTLTTPDAFEFVDLIDVELRGVGEPPSKPILHIGCAQMAVRARPLGAEYWRLTLDRPAPLRPGDRAVLRDPGRREVWAISTLDVSPPPLQRRGAALARSAALGTLDGSALAYLRMQGVVSLPRMRRLGFSLELDPDDAVSSGSWLMAPGHLRSARRDLEQLVANGATQGAWPSEAEACRRLDLPSADLLALLVTDRIRRDSGYLVHSTLRLENHAPEMEWLREHLSRHRFASATLAELTSHGFTQTAVRALKNSEEVMVLGDLVLMQGRDDAALEALGQIASPFTVSEARAALRTNRRTTLALLSHLDDDARTVRIDSRHRVIAGPT